MNQTIKQQLVALGFNEYEAGVYLVLTEHSPSSAAFVAKNLNLSRSTVYTALDRLVARGLVGTSYKNEIKQFVAQPPSSIGDLLDREEASLKEKRHVFDGLSEHLDLLRRGSALVPNIIFFEGKESLKKIYLSMLRNAPKHSVMRIIRDEFVWDKEWGFIFGQEWNDKVRRLRSENDVTTKLLVNDSREERAQMKFYGSRSHTEVRVLSKDHPVDRFVTYVLGDTVSILSMEQNNLVGIKITNRHIAANFEQVFDGIWDVSKKRPMGR